MIVLVGAKGFAWGQPFAFFSGVAQGIVAVLARARASRTGFVIGRSCATSVVDERLARRLRLGQNWQQLIQSDSRSDALTSAFAMLVKQGRLSANSAQEAGAVSLAQLHGARAAAKEARQHWDEEQMRRTSLAEAAAERVRNSREAAAKHRKKGTWFKKAPETPTHAAVIGPMCWLDIGPPPSMKPAGCYLHGPVGSGKTTLMDLFALFGRGNLRLRRQHFHEFALWLHQSLRDLGRGTNAPVSGLHILEGVADLAAEDADILCLDEFAVTNVADAAIFAELMRLLAERCVPFVCTTNRPPSDLYKDGLHRERYLPSLIARIQNDYNVVAIDGSDYREALLRKESEAAFVRVNNGLRGASVLSSSLVFFHGCDVERALSEAFATETGGHPKMHPERVAISWGRSLAVPGVSAGIARFHFNDLCRHALNGEDFVHLAKLFHTVFVHDIPQLAVEEHNEARRFTNLVDALYEHSVRLICHSNVPLGNILSSVEALHAAGADFSEGHSANRMGLFETMYDDTPNFQLQIKEAGGRQKYMEIQARLKSERALQEARSLSLMVAPEAADGDAGSGWSAAPAVADFSAPQEGVAGVMVAAVGSLQESGFAARRAISRLKEMQTSAYLEAASRRRESDCRQRLNVHSSAYD